MCKKIRAVREDSSIFLPFRGEMHLAAVRGNIRPGIHRREGAAEVVVKRRG